MIGLLALMTLVVLVEQVVWYVQRFQMQRCACCIEDTQGTNGNFPTAKIRRGMSEDNKYVNQSSTRIQ